jgi:hypothetical protein
MKTYVQFKDGVAFATVSSSGEVEGAVEVSAELADTVLNKKYINGEWVPAEKIIYATLNNAGDTVIQLDKTFYSSDVKNGAVVVPNEEVSIGWSWNGTTFSAPVVIEPVPLELVREVVQEVQVEVPVVVEPTPEP